MIDFQVEVFARIFTMIGKDMARSGCLTELTVHLRDAFLCSHHLDLDDSTRKKLLHLIELQSGDWQLSPDAITYYSSSHNKVAKELVVPKIVTVQ